MVQGYVIAKQDLKILDILTVSDYEINLNSEFSGKSTVKTVRAPTYEQGDYFFLNDGDGVIYRGVIDTVDNENGQNLHTLNLLEIENIFDRKIVIDGEDLISSTGIEDFIKHEIELEFSKSDDALLNLDYLEVVAATHTKIAASVTTDSGGIYNFLTFLGNAREYYGIFYDFEFTGRELTITVSKKDQELFKFDSTVTDIHNYDEVYSVDALAKLTAVWKVPDSEDENGNTIIGPTTILKRYLKTDRTTTDDVNDPDRAVGTIDTIYIECETEEEALQKITDEFKGNSYSHSVTADVRRSSQIYPEEMFYIGHECEIKTVSHGIKDSLITSVTKKMGQEYISIKFGNMAVTLIEKLRKERS